jgi:acyl transferase domain-containing protein
MYVLRDAIMHTTDDAANGQTPIAIIGLSFKFPGDATSAESLWSMMVDGRCASQEFPEDRLNGAALYNPDRSRGESVSIYKTRSFVSSIF